MTLKEYINDYPYCLEHFQHKYPDGSEEDYINSEKDKFSETVIYYENRAFFIEGGDFTWNQLPTQSEYLTANKILDFLNGKLMNVKQEHLSYDDKFIQAYQFHKDKIEKLKQRKIERGLGELTYEDLNNYGCEVYLGDSLFDKIYNDWCDLYQSGMDMEEIINVLYNGLQQTSVDIMEVRDQDDPIIIQFSELLNDSTLLINFFALRKAINDSIQMDKLDKSKNKPNVYPSFKPEIIDIVFELLKDYFSEPDQVKLFQLLQNPSEDYGVLVFLDTGNRLADAFKQLYDSDFILGCQKKDLQCWIKDNFKFTYHENVKAFKLKYLEDIISTDKEKCAREILTVKNDPPLGKKITKS